ncbi:peptidase domain-containing ABC transporter [Flavicella sediminum]|uniref:peptidase domain-containing ABC transporter n=1 Tax=Flavicella sediminum TaxID=2585141 RepID=UPI001121A1C2|nr:peptidase domain-containing ABC transporter [Flavicella sediminum]
MNLKHIKNTHVLQHDQTDCGTACLLSVVRYYKGENSLEKLRKLSGTNQRGTTLLGLLQAANGIGFRSVGNQADIQALIEHGSPLILHVLIEEKLEHYVICYGYENDKFCIGDPAKGILFYSEEELETIWKSKYCLTLTPSSSFAKATQLKSAKRKWFFNLLRKDKQLLGLSVVLGIGIALLGMAMAIFSQKLIDDILPSQDIKKLITGIALLSFLLLIRIGFTALRQFLLLQQSKNFNNRIIDVFYTSLLHLPKPFFDTRKIGELVARLNDTGRIQKVILFMTKNMVIDFLNVFISSGFLFWYSWQTGCIALLSLPVYFFMIYRFNSKIIAAQKEVMYGYALNESNYINSMQGIATIKNDNKQSFFQKINKIIYGNYQDKIVDLGKVNIHLSLFSGVAGSLFLIAILSYTSFQVFDETLKLGELMAILGIAGALLPSITNLALVSIPINEAKIAFDRMYEFTTIEKEKQEGIVLTEFNSLEIRNASFRFAGRKQLLTGINMSVKKGELVAIVGESGGGKSILTQIIQRFYKFETGNVLINSEIELENIGLDSWRDTIGVIPQEISIFNGRLIDNLLLGSEDAPKLMIDFCQENGFEKFITQMPQGFATIVGEEGINLSGGQKQIIALIRVLYKKPQLLLLDEATSAMDRNTERFTLDLLQKLKNKMGIVFVSHRLHSLKNRADRIYVLENGTIQNKGMHNELIEKNNFYSQFWKELYF